MNNDVNLFLPRAAAHTILMAAYSNAVSTPQAETVDKLKALAPSRAGSPVECVKACWVTTLTSAYAINKTPAVPDFRCNRYDSLACVEKALAAFNASI